MKLYRGFNNNYPKTLGVRPEQKGVWMTEDFNEALRYAKEFKDGLVAEIDVDDSVYLASEDICFDIFGDYFSEEWNEPKWHKRVCSTLKKYGYDGYFFDDCGVYCYYIFNRELIKGYKIIKKVHNKSIDNDEKFMQELYKSNNIKLDKDAMESLNESLSNKPVSFTAYHGGVEPDMIPDEGRAFYLTDSYNLAHQFARREVYDDGLYEGEIPTVFTFKGTFKNPYYLTDDEYDSEGQDSNIDYQKWVDMGVDGLVYEGHTTYYIVIDLSTIKLVDKKVFEDEAILDESVILKEDIAAVQKYFPKIQPNDFNKLIKLDPTYQGGNELGKYGKWILSLYNNYIKDDIAYKKWEDQKNQGNNYPEPVRKSSEKLEDFEKLPDLLRQYDVINNKVKNNIFNIKSISDLYSFVNNSKSQGISDNSKVNHAKDLVKKSVAKGGEIVFQDNNWIVLIPKTLESSVVFGNDTNWCTTSPNGEMYNRYKQEYGGEYFINVNLKNGDLYQFHFESEQFMDSSDEDIGRILDFLNYKEDLYNFYANYSEKTQLGLLDACYEEHQMFNVFKHIKNPSEKIQMEVIKFCPGCIKHIKNPSEKIQMEVIKNKPYCIKYIENPSDKVQLEAVKQDAFAFEYIKNPSEELQIKAVKEKPYCIKYIENPSEKVQMTAVKEAIKQDFHIVRICAWIKNPTPKVKEYVEKMKNIKESKIPSLRVDEKKFKSSIFNVLLESNILTEDIEAVKKYFPKVPEEKIQTLIELDPTYQGGDNLGKFGKWILGLYNKGQLKDEDFYKVPQYLTTFKDNLKKIQNKDIMSYKTLPDLAQAIQPYEGQKDVSKKQKIKQLKSDEAEKVLETGSWLIVHPKTHAADCYYGANTKWCTASKDDDTWFDDYNEIGPLFILINKKNNEKFQFHFQTQSFMNELDKPEFPQLIISNDSEVVKWFKQYAFENIDNIIEEYNENNWDAIDFGGSTGYAYRVDITDILNFCVQFSESNLALKKIVTMFYEELELEGFGSNLIYKLFESDEEFKDKCDKLVAEYSPHDYFIKTYHYKTTGLFTDKDFRHMLFRKLNDSVYKELARPLLDKIINEIVEIDEDDNSFYVEFDENELVNSLYQWGDFRNCKEKLMISSEGNRVNFSDLGITTDEFLKDTVIKAIKEYFEGNDDQIEFNFEESLKNWKNPFLD